MPEEKKSYSLISVDAASADEDVIRVDAAGVHEVSAQSAPEAGEEVSAPSYSEFAEIAVDAEIAEDATHSPESDVPLSGDVTGDSDETDEATKLAEDLDASVPMAGLQKVIFIVLAIGLIGFIAYFVMTHM